MPNLVGTGLNQVPTNGMLGGLAYQSPDHASIKDLDLKNLSQINSEIADTAVDIFIYDTSKDSDGGAWRHRTSHTSWYNETLNTATRGSRKEFPAVAVIVSVGNEITIYDGDDPSLPMWMYFQDTNTSAGIMAWINVNGGSSCVSTSMLNGKLSAGFNSSIGGLYTIDFLKDTINIDYTTTLGYSIFNNDIRGRNTGYSRTIVDSGRGLVNRSVNDVAMTVLPNAPIDDATGLPIPTIAVGTDGGVSIIKDDGTVVDITITTGANNDGDRVDFTDDNRVVVQWGGDSAGEITIDEIPSADISQNYPINLPGSHYNDNSPSSYSPIFLTEGPSQSNRHPTAIQQFRAVGTTAALSLFDENKTSEEDGMVAYATTSYNTGWMQGRIKGAFLSDTDATNVTGSELIDNGDFGTGDFTNWSIGGNTTPTISSGGALLTAAAGIDGYVWQSTSGESTSGKWVITWTVTQINGGFLGLLLNTTQPVNSSSYSTGGLGIVLDGITTSGSYYYEGNITSIEFRHRGGSSSIIDNISLRRVESDRSVNNNPIQVFGTVTKSAVATGAELVAYSGWNSANYLFQPYNSDLDFTDTMMIMLWVKGWESSDDLLHRGPNQTRNSKTSFALYCDGGYDYRLILSANGSTEQDFEILLDTNQSGWQHLCFTLSNGTVRGFLNGQEKTLTSSTFFGTVFSQATDQNGLWIGRGPVSGYPVNAHIALLRLSASAPSAEQIKKIYEDEKVLFQENADCTLYGSSDAVTALAYDEVTERLHVGTSGGRSEFQGLRRINNTTTAVTTAISAYDSFVVEQ